MGSYKSSRLENTVLLNVERVAMLRSHDQECHLTVIIYYTIYYCYSKYNVHTTKPSLNLLNVSRTLHKTVCVEYVLTTISCHLFCS